MPRAVEVRAGSSVSRLAGRPAPRAMLIDVAGLERRYFELSPDLSDPRQLVSFGTSGHRGSPLHGTFVAPGRDCERGRSYRDRRPELA